VWCQTSCYSRWPWRLCVAGVIRSLRRFWHGRPRHLTPAVADEFSHWRCCTRLVPVFQVGHTQYVQRGPARSSIVYLTCCVPLGILFIMYSGHRTLCPSSNAMNCLHTSTPLCERHASLYGSCSPCDVDSFLTRVSQCSCAIAEWMQSNSNRLQLNCDKTHFV